RSPTPPSASSPSRRRSDPSAPSRSARSRRSTDAVAPARSELPLEDEPQLVAVLLAVVHRVERREEDVEVLRRAPGDDRADLGEVVARELLQELDADAGRVLLRLEAGDEVELVEITEGHLALPLPLSLAVDAPDVHVERVVLARLRIPGEDPLQ